ncbi:type II secretion system protein GspG [Myxococcota bacterium]|nr:type II secretion system protein GspG [Myxococcota bacterium]
MIAIGAVPMLVGLWLSANLQSTGGQGGLETTKRVLRNTEQNLAMYAVRHKGIWPKNVEELRGVVKCFPDEAWPVDAWGRPIAYLPIPDGYVLMSLGKDGMLGGEGLDYDLVVVGPPTQNDLSFRYREPLVP